MLGPLDAVPCAVPMTGAATVVSRTSYSTRDGAVFASHTA
jgi:hypothetical protein